MAKKRSGRPQVPPPALRTRPGEPFEGFDVLEEAASELVLPVLWQALRDVILWGETPPDAGQEQLFAPGAAERRRALLERMEITPELWEAFSTFSALLEVPGSISRERVAKACREVAAWAEERGLPRTALGYAYAAAAALPEDAQAAYRVGLLSRQQADYARADSWFRRAIGLARRRREPLPYALAYVGLGNLYFQRGNYLTAWKMLDRALRAARRHGLRGAKAMALHDLFIVFARLKRFEEAEKYARQAHKAYGPGHRRQVRLAQDVATFWLVQRHFHRALSVFSALPKVVTHVTERLCLHGNIAYATGGLQQPYAFMDAWTEAWRIIDSHPDEPRVASVALDLANGAAMLQDWERVQVAASFAFSTALRRKEEGVRDEAERLLEEAREKAAFKRPAPRVADVSPSETTDAFALSLIRTLEAIAADS